MKSIDLNTWHRREHFHFFMGMNDPYTGVVVNVDCTHAKQRAKEIKTSFWLYYMHKSLMAAYNTEPFRYRITEDKQVMCVDTLYAGTTIDNVHGSYSIASLSYYENYAQFAEEATSKMNEIRERPGLNFTEEAKRIENILYTTAPWLRFTGLKHATHIGALESRPKISFGQCFEENGKWLMPLSIEVNHALMDGKDIGAHIDLFQRLLSE